MGSSTEGSILGQYLADFTPAKHSSLGLPLLLPRRTAATLVNGCGLNWHVYQSICQKPIAAKSHGMRRLLPSFLWGLGHKGTLMQPMPQRLATWNHPKNHTNQMKMWNNRSMHHHTLFLNGTPVRWPRDTTHGRHKQSSDWIHSCHLAPAASSITNGCRLSEKRATPKTFPQPPCGLAFFNEVREPWKNMKKYVGSFGLSGGLQHQWSQP